MNEKMTPRRAIVLHCRSCIENHKPMDCEITDCPSWVLRSGRRVTDENGKGISPLRTIRKHCLDCCCNGSEEVANCLDPECELYRFRFGKDPRFTGKVNPGIIAMMKSRGLKPRSAMDLDDETSEGVIIPEEQQATKSHW